MYLPSVAINIYMYLPFSLLFVVVSYITNAGSLWINNVSIPSPPPLVPSFAYQFHNHPALLAWELAYLPIVLKSVGMCTLYRDELYCIILVNWKSLGPEIVLLVNLKSLGQSCPVFQ